MPWPRRSSEGMRVAVNLLTDDPHNPSGAHWFWTRVIPEMAVRLRDDEELRLLVSPRLRSMHAGYPGRVSHLTFPWSNEHTRLRTLSEQVYAPVRLPLDGVDVFSTLIAPAVRPAPAVVAHFKTMHAFTTPEAIRAAWSAGTARRAIRTRPRSRTRSSSTPRACAPRSTSTSTSTRPSCT